MEHALVFVWAASEIILAIVRRARGPTVTKADRASFAILWATIGVAIPVALAIPASKGICYLPGYRANWIRAGELLIIAGLVIRWAAILTLKDSFTVDVAVRSDQEVIDRGLYRLVRHPSYLGSLLSFVGLGLTFLTLLSLLTLVVPVTAAFLYRIHVEEQALRAGLGVGYASYASRTKRLVPFLF